MKTIRAAFAFFTRIPVGPWPLPDNFRGVLAWIPLVGLVVGGVTGAVVAGLHLFLPPLLCGVLGCLVWEMLTGGLHLDGVADCGDGLLVEQTPQRRLEIMKDSRLGTFGGTALCFTLLLKIAAIASLCRLNDVYDIVSVCAAAGILARSCIFLTVPYPSARPGGLGDAIRDGLRPIHVIPAVVMLILMALAIGYQALIAIDVALLVAWGLLHQANKRLGGVTGDVFGCLIETVEWVVLIVFCF